jgi:hypothetical protein
MGMAAHRAQERIDLEVRRLRDLTEAVVCREGGASSWVREHLQSAAVDLKAFRRDGDFST